MSLDSTALGGLAASAGPLAEQLQATFSDVSVLDYAVKVTSEKKSPLIPQTLHLKENCLNPFNGMTEICYGLQKDGLVKISIFNLLGQ